MSCNNDPIAPVVSCLNSVVQVLAHYDYVRDCDTGAVLGVNVKLTDAAGNPLPYSPGTDVLTPGECPVVTTPSGQDWEFVYYDDSAVIPGNVCRKIILRLNNDPAPSLDGYELNGLPVPGFDPMLVKEKCPCTSRTPAVVW